MIILIDAPTNTCKPRLNSAVSAQHAVRMRYNKQSCASAFLCVAVLLFAGFASCTELLITNYGAVAGDDIDDLGAIAAAIAAANAGDVVRVPSGIFVISNTIHLDKDGVSLLGSPDGTSSIFALFADDMISVDSDNTEVAYLTWDGDSLATNGIVVTGSTSVKIHHNTIQNFVSTEFGPMGIYLASDVTDSHIYNNTIINIGTASEWGSGIRMSWRSHRNLIENNSIDLTGRGGIFCSDNSTYNVIRGNTITRSGQHSEGLGIEAWGGCNMTLIENNNIDHWISLDNSHFCAVRNNVIVDLDRDMAIGLEAVAVSHGVFTDNQALDGQLIGLSISNTMRKEYVFFGYNTFTNNGVWGAQLQGETGGIHSYYFYKNVFRNTQTTNPASPYPDADGHGLRINGNTFNTVFEANDMSNNQGLGIQSFAPVDGLEFIDNIITYNADDAFDGDQGTEFLWEGNTVASNGYNNQFTPSGISNQRPVSDFDYTVNGLTVTFTARASDPDGTVAEYLWDFSDGLPTNEANPTHTYPAAGNYRVTLLVWDNEGRGARSEDTIQVGQSSTSPDSPSTGKSPSTSATDTPESNVRLSGSTPSINWSALVFIASLIALM